MGLLGCLLPGEAMVLKHARLCVGSRALNQIQSALARVFHLARAPGVVLRVQRHKQAYFLGIRVLEKATPVPMGVRSLGAESVLGGAVVVLFEGC